MGTQPNFIQSAPVSSPQNLQTWFNCLAKQNIGEE